MEKKDKRYGKRIKKEVTKGLNKKNLDELFQFFMETKVAEGRSKTTLQQYQFNFKYFTDYLGKIKIGSDLSLLTTNILRKYIIFMMNTTKFEDHPFKPEEVKTTGLAPTTINTRFKTLRVFFRFLVEEGYLNENPIKSVKNVREPEEHIDVLSYEELKKLLNSPDQSDYSGFRDFVLINVLIDSMARISEVLSLTVEDVDFKTHMITIHGHVAKSRKARLIPIQKRTSRLIQDLLVENDEFDSDKIFQTNYGEPRDRNHFRKRLKDFAINAGISKNVHPHLLRHTAATLFLEAGGDMRHLQMLLGHSDLRMVMRYTHLSNQALVNQHSQYSPMNKLYLPYNKKRKTKRQG